MAHVIQERYHVYASRSGQFWRNDPGLLTEIAKSYEAARQFLDYFKSSLIAYEWFILRRRIHGDGIHDVIIAQSKGARF